jgi:pyruvate,water dikinase
LWEPGTDLRALVAGRRALYERNLRLTPPAVVVGRFDPEAFVPDAVDGGRKVFHGLGVSAGTATGRARVILRSDATERVRPGEILVAPFTDPGWTPYFLAAAGIVMDMGGMLSHGSIVAREYGIPAVVNVGPATQIIRTGQWLEVDADRGVVKVLDAAPETPAENGSAVQPCRG